MAITVNVHEAKTHFSRLLEQAHAGQEIILSKAGKPYARMVPLRQQEKPRRMPGRLAGCIDEAFFEPLPEAELDAWEKP
ncbi:MAG: type II toxin-antitoxin system prevent-host-death family antitoxin [Thiobacillus sp.]|nr:type II toxin-antitoxin system prevent-host-death family antitoxin [Thiobacillus sp.]